VASASAVDEGPALTTPPTTGGCTLHMSYTVPSSGRLKVTTTIRCTGDRQFAMSGGYSVQRGNTVLDTGYKQCVDTTTCSWTSDSVADPAGSQTWQVGGTWVTQYAPSAAELDHKTGFTFTH
jgi:hypothetical protein